ncbi:hypothetical protein AVEN_142594-1 [Araneus ventricosus]|uniref:Uncharacterized protein n=1 Tax=Araneus ventricosus TaxID=182803 RepID=A0A4Y2VFA6_ARAVE|nr:hypothetical protein AVEN_142594-1 [Araneus ventricosus]
MGRQLDGSSVESSFAHDYEEPIRMTDPRWNECFTLTYNLESMGRIDGSSIGDSAMGRIHDGSSQWNRVSPPTHDLAALDGPISGSSGESCFDPKRII